MLVLVPSEPLVIIIRVMDGALLKMADIELPQYLLYLRGGGSVADIYPYSGSGLFGV